MYKHHISHLHSIYTKEMSPEEIGEGCILPNMIPVSQLYGMKGLVTNTPEYQKKIKNREGGWDHNFVAAQSLKQPSNSQESMMHSVNNNNHNQQSSSINGNNKLQMPSRSLSPVARRNNNNNNISSSGGIYTNNSYDQGSTGTLKGVLPSRSVASIDTTTSTSAIKTRRSRCNKKDISDRDLIIIGQYRFNEEQLHIYNKFTEMLTEFDEFDIKNILEDAWKDSLMSSRLETYGGTMVENESSYIEDGSQIEINPYR